MSIFEKSKENQYSGDVVKSTFYNVIHFSNTIARQSDFNVVKGSVIGIVLNINSDDEKKKPTGPPPLLFEGIYENVVARADIRLDGFDVATTYLYFSTQGDTARLRGIILR